MNKIYSGDCLFVMKHDIPKESVDLIYLDPPFFTGSIQKGNVSTSSGVVPDWQPGAMEISFDDSKKFWETKLYYDAPEWLNHIAKDLKREVFASYLHYMMKRLEMCKNVLKPTGSIYLHCDYRASHYLKMIMDEIFGYENFLSEIVWYYKKYARSSSFLVREHQVILRYSKTQNFKFNPVYALGMDKTREFKEEHVWSWDSHTKKILVYKSEEFKEIKEGLKIPGGRNKGRMIMDLINEEGWTISSYDYIGSHLTDVWCDIPNVKNPSYPTQKPIELVERIIEISSDPDDLILDPFSGGGTTIVAAEKLKRKWLGIDINPDACIVMKRRLETEFKSSPTIIRRQLREVLELEETPLEQWVNEFYNATKPSPDRGIDGITIDGIPIQTKTGMVRYDIVSQFSADMKLHEKVPKPITKGIIFSRDGFDSSAISTVFKINHMEGIEIELVTPQDILGDEA